MKKLLYSELSGAQLEQASHAFPGMCADQQFRYVVTLDGEVIGRELITEPGATEASATERLVRIETDGITKYFRPGAVQAIEGRMFGCDVYLANADSGKLAKVFVSLDPDRVALLLGLV